ncbi:MAG: helix-turn-helix domain-containing protein [Geminicoccaceae bacterium]
MNRLAVDGSIAGTRGARRSRPQEIDRYVSSRIRQRRIMLGITQHQLAELIGVTYQQAHKYERAVNRVSAGRLYQISLALGVEIGYFFEGAEPGDGSQSREQQLIPQQRMLLELARNFSLLENHKYQEAICHMARALSHRI